MSDDLPKQPLDSDEKLLREIREGRKFSLAEAIGRMGGPGMMKGESPATRKLQAEVRIEEYLKRRLRDGAGAMTVVLLRQVKESDLLIANLDQPRVVLTGYVQRVLDSEYGLQEFVRECDAEWGRVFEERPYFEKQGVPPNPDDPYTIESVRAALVELIQKLNEVDA